MAEVHTEAEERIGLACRTRDFAAATTHAVEAYGPEILSFLIGRLRSESDGEEAFSMFAEDLWRGLPAFEFRCSVRGYLYTLARNAANRYARAPHNRRTRDFAVTENAAVSALVERVRTATQLHQRTDVKSKVRALRESLAEEDQLLLTLHIDRALPWREIAMIVHEQGEQLDSITLEREASRLRKRFERLKVELKELARKSGLMDS